jgi:hypothetical protein
MGGWGMIMLGMVAVIAIFVLLPGARRAIKHAPKAEQGDWKTVVLILAVVVGFVFLLIKMV